MKIKTLVTVIAGATISIYICSCNINSVKSPFNNNLGAKSPSNMVNITSLDWHYSYNNKHLLEAVIDPNGNTTNFSYDTQGRLSRVTNALQQSLQYADFDRYGHPQTMIDANGNVTKLGYTPDGWLSSSTIDGATTSFSYDNIGQLTAMILPDGHTLNYSYDDAMRLMEVSDNTGTIKYTRDLAGNITSTTINGLQDIVYAEQKSYDEINRLRKLTTETSTTSYDYDTFNGGLPVNLPNPDLITDGMGNKTAIYYDGMNRVRKVIDAKNGATIYDFDNKTSFDHPANISDARGNNTLYKYNGLDNLLSMTNPDSGNHSYTAYDGNGNLLSQQDARGNLINYHYDALNRPLSIDYVDSTDNTLFSYDSGVNAKGKLSKVQNGISSNSYVYDVRGNVSNEVQHINDSDYELHYGYDKANNLTSIVYPSGVQVSYTYTNGVITHVNVDGDNLVDVTHLPFGPINKLAYANGIDYSMTYSKDFKIKSLNVNNGVLQRNYSYYANGQIKSITGVDANYVYDAVGNLIQDESSEYNYDALSNRVSNKNHEVTTAYTIDGKSNKLLTKTFSSINSEYKYDSAGNLIKVGSSNYIYDSLNRLTAVTIDNLQKNGKDVASYQYNAFSQRIMKNVSDSKTIFIYNIAGQLLEEQNLAQNTVRDYIYVDGKLIAAKDNGIVIFIITDHLNAPQVLLDNSGKVIWSAKYDSFGKATITGNLKLNLRADGQYQDDETGLYYNWYRYYSPDLGRYITSDPLGLQAGTNTYIYVNGNPINYTDRQGLCPMCVVAEIVMPSLMPGFVISAGIETTAQLVNNDGDMLKLNLSNIAFAGVSGSVMSGFGGYTSAAAKAGQMTYANATLYNTLVGGITSAGQQVAVNKCSGEPITKDLWKSTYTGGLANGVTNGFGYASRLGFKSGAEAIAKKGQDDFIKAASDLGEFVGNGSSGFGIAGSQLIISNQNQPTNKPN